MYWIVDGHRTRDAQEALSFVHQGGETLGELTAMLLEIEAMDDGEQIILNGYIVDCVADDD